MFVKKEDWDSLVRRVEFMEKRWEEHENFIKYHKFVEEFPDRVSYGLEAVRDNDYDYSSHTCFPSWGYPYRRDPIFWAGHITYVKKGKTDVVKETVVKSTSVSFHITDAKWDIDDRHILVHCHADKSKYVIKWDTTGNNHKLIVNGIEFPIVQKDANGCIIFS